MIWLIEHRDSAVPLEIVAVDEIRKVVDPIQRRIADVLHEFADEDDLTVVFSIDDDGALSVKFRGKAFSVNRARDLLGEEFAIVKDVN